ncbi:unnamed protein product, partial [Allacma fusca]
MSEGPEGWTYDLSSDSIFTVYCSGTNNTIKSFQYNSIPAWCGRDGNVQTEYGTVTLDDLLCSTLVT